MTSLTTWTRNIAIAGTLALTLFAGAVITSLPGAKQSAMADDKPAATERLLRHVVLFKFKDSSSDAEVQKVVDAFGELKEKISEIHSYEHGTDNSPEGLADGFTHCFLVTFKSEADRDAYLPHKDHQAFVEILKPHLDKVLVVDYWAKN